MKTMNLKNLVKTGVLAAGIGLGLAGTISGQTGQYSAQPAAGQTVKQKPVVAFGNCNSLDRLPDLVLLPSSGVPMYFLNNNGYFEETSDVVLQVVESLK